MKLFRKIVNANQAARIQCDEVLIELGLGSDATVIVREPGSNVVPFKRRKGEQPNK